MCICAICNGELDDDVVLRPVSAALMVPLNIALDGKDGARRPPYMFHYPRCTIGKMGVPHVRQLDAKGPAEGGNLEDATNHVVSVWEGA